MDIYDFIDPKSNDLISKFSYNDMLELIDRLRKYKISYRNSLSFANFITFGVEIEVCSKDEKTQDKLISELTQFNKYRLDDEWYFDCEDRVPFCTEFVSPILIDNKKTWTDLKNVCKILRSNDVLVTNDTAGHIHYGVQILENNVDTWLNFIKLWSVYENIIYRFSYGEYEKERDLLKICANPISSKYLRIYNDLSNKENVNLKGVLDKLNPSYKSEAIGLYNYNPRYFSSKRNSTIEIRCPNSSSEEIIWQNNINFFYHLLKFCSSDNFNHEVIERRIYDILGIQNDLSLYREIFIEQAIELSDLIFDNNLDKLNFLRQYLKDFSTSNDFIKCKRFIV